MEDSMEPTSGRKRKLSSTHGKKSKGHKKVEDVESDSPNEVPSTTNGSTRSRKQDDCWPDFLSEAELDLLVSIKKLAMERSTSIKEECLQEILPASVLQTIGILMKELIKDHARKLVCAHKSRPAREALHDPTEDSVREV